MQCDSLRVTPSGDSVRMPGGIYIILPGFSESELWMHIVLFQRIYCTASGAQWLTGPRGNTYLVAQRIRVLTVGLCGTSHLLVAYGHFGFLGAVLLCSMDSLEVQQ